MSKSQDWYAGYGQGLRDGKGHCIRTLANLIYGEYPQPVKQALVEAEQRGESNGPDVREGTFQIEE